MDWSYDGFYAQFETPSKKIGSMLMGPDNIVGADYEYEFRNENGRAVVWINNKFGAEVGFLDAEGSRKVQLAHAREMKIRMLLSFVAYSDMPDPGLYWGEMAIFCYNPAYAEEMDAFVDRVRAKMADGARPDINLRSSGVQKIFDEPDWVPTESVPLPDKAKGMAVLKDHQSMSEKMIEQGRGGNRGCYAVSIAFLVVVVLAAVFGIAKLMGVL